MNRWLLILSLLGAFPVGTAFAQSDVSADELSRTPNPFKYEPTAAETVRKSLEYFRVSPEAFDRLRTASQVRGWLPTIATGYRFYDLGVDQEGEQTVTDPAETSLNRNDRYNSFTVGAIWDFRQIVFNPSEVQVYGLVGVQRDVMLEVTRTYFLRRQLVLRLALDPPNEPLSRASLELRVDEFTAILDVLTGAWFSEESTKRRSRGSKRSAEVGDMPFEGLPGGPRRTRAN